MTDNRLATVGDVIAALSGYDAGTPLRIAVEPGYPMEHRLAQVACAPGDANGTGATSTHPPVVWLGTGEQLGYLPASAADALGWS
jgi:hypothetical protein